MFCSDCSVMSVYSNSLFLYLRAIRFFEVCFLAAYPDWVVQVGNLHHYQEGLVVRADPAMSGVVGLAAVFEIGDFELFERIRR